MIGNPDKVETSSPTASSDAILLTLVIDTVEQRDVLADICCEVSMLSSHLALPKEGHLKQATTSYICLVPQEIP